jgi:uncharacterized membrane protein YeaQ/YmgE (transglycosylase-associated protein family)
MSILVALIIGVGIGTAGQYLLQKELDTLLMSILSGMVGSILGLACYVILDFNAATSTLFSLPATLFCMLGALLAVVIFAAIHKFMEQHSAQVNTEQMENESKMEKNPSQEKEQD